MERLAIGKKYRTKNNNNEIDFDYKVLDISNKKVVFEVLANRTSLPFYNYNSIECLNYDLNSQFVKNSEELV